MTRAALKKLLSYFSVFEWLLWAVSCAAMVTLYVIFDRSNYLSLITSIVGSTSLIFIAKGNPIGNALSIAFSGLYAYVAFTYAYYGEMITYLAMSAPLAAFALVVWLRHPHAGNHAQVSVSEITKKDVALMFALTAAVTTAFYFVLDALGTANLVPSTISIATSFSACFLILKRSPYYAVAYMLNDVVLIVLWALAVAENITYISTLVCFVAFLANDIYSFYNWRRMKKAQASPAPPPETDNSDAPSAPGAEI